MQINQLQEKLQKAQEMPKVILKSEGEIEKLTADQQSKRSDDLLTSDESSNENAENCVEDMDVDEPRYTNVTQL